MQHLTLENIYEQEKAELSKFTKQESAGCLNHIVHCQTLKRIFESNIC